MAYGLPVEGDDGPFLGAQVEAVPTCDVALRVADARREMDLSGADVVVLPGGFSYGDYLRAGAIARFSPIMAAVVAHANRGAPVLAICNGFQVACEAGLLPGALLRNASLSFVAETVRLRVESADSMFTSGYETGQLLRIPIAHGEGCYFADAATLDDLERDGQVLFRYVRPDGSPAGEDDDAANPNGSLRAIAGVMNAAGNVAGLMPHPERASEAILGSEDGLGILRSFVEAARVAGRAGMAVAG